MTSTTGVVDDGDCMTPPPAPALIGWASEGGGTEGGGSATPVVVTSASEFSNAVSGNAASVVHLNGTISGDFGVGSNKTIIGICGAELRGSLHVSNQQNVIVRNLKVVGYNCSDSPQECGAGQDAVHVQGSHHLWFDHLDVSDGSDGNLDMTHDSDYITISWTKFWYSNRRTDPEQGASGHRFSNLIGASDSDAGEYRITFHHNWWADNIDQRMPRSRFGDIHVFNNLFTASGNSYCTNAGISTHLLVENNIYRGVNNPLSPDGNGDMRAQGNVFDDVTGNQSDNGGQGFDPSYDYTLDPTDGLDTSLQSEVGPHD
jgi:pectate lyase